MAVVFCNLFADGYGYEWGGAAYLNPWGLGSKLARVTAHEVAHIFGALDEYGDCNCSAANSNCAACGPPRQLCLMDVDYAWALCDATRRSLGWQ